MYFLGMVAVMDEDCCALHELLDGNKHTSLKIKRDKPTVPTISFNSYVCDKNFE